MHEKESQENIEIQKPLECVEKTEKRSGEIEPDGSNAKEQKPKSEKKYEYTRVGIPVWRMRLLRENWTKLFGAVISTFPEVELKMNLSEQAVEIRTTISEDTTKVLERVREFFHAFKEGFDAEDVSAILHCDDLYIERFNLREIRIMNSSSLARAVGRVVGFKGKIKNTLENISNTKILIRDTHCSVLGLPENIRLAKRSISELVIGLKPETVCTNMRMSAKRLKERSF